MNARPAGVGPVACEAAEGLSLDLEVPYAASFRRFQTTSLLLSYPVPPFTTLRGMLANALGLAWADPLWPELERQLLLNVRPLGKLQPQSHMVKLLKASPSAVESRQIPTRRFPSSPVHQEFYLRPTYRVYLATRERSPEGGEGWLDALQDALADPARPLFLGRSDDMVVVSVHWRGRLERSDAAPLWGLVPAASVEGEWLRLPWAVAGREYPLFAGDLVLPRHPPVSVDGVPAYLFGDESVALLGWEEEHAA